MPAEAKEARVRRTDARSGTWELLFCAITEPALVNVVEINGENGRNYFNVLVDGVNAPKKSLRGMEYNAESQQNDLEIFSLRANIFCVASSSYECIPRSLQWVFFGVIEGCSTALWAKFMLEIPASIRSGFFRISRLFPRWFDDIDISKKYQSGSIPATLDFSSSPYICAGWHALPWTRPASQQQGPALTQSRALKPQSSPSPTLLRQMRRHNKKLRDCENLRGEQS